MNILNFGSLNIDHVYQVEHFVRPGETISSLGYQRNPGGKGLNQSVALARAGARVWHAGRIGADGRFLLDALADSGVDVSLLEAAEAVTGHACIQVDASGQNCIVLHGGANREITPAYADRVLERFSAGDILMLQNEINDPEYVARRAVERGMRVALNPSPMDEAMRRFDYGLVTWLLLNEIEGAEITGQREPEAILEELLRWHPGLRVVLTLGSEGSVYRDAERRAAQPVYPVRAVDTTAAGDTFSGYFLTEIAAGAPVGAAMETASLAAAMTVSREGASCSIPTRAEVEAFRQTTGGK